MAELAFYRFAKFTESLLMALWNKQRIVAKTLLPTRRLGDMTFAYTLKEMSLRRITSACYFCQGNLTNKSCGALLRWHTLKFA